MPRRPAKPPSPRRPRGTGTVTLRKDGLWAAVRPRSIDPARKPTYHHTKDEAETWLARQLVRFLRGTGADAGSEPLGSFLERWYERREIDWRPQSREARAVQIRHAESLSEIPLEQLTPRHFDELFTMLRREGGPNGTPLASRTVNAVRSTIASALETAVGQALERNPVQSVKPSRVPKSRADAWGEDEAARFLAACHGTRYGLFYRMALETGARQGELRALQWEDIDVVKARLTVRHSLSSAHRVLGPTKSGAIRDIELSRSTVDALVRHRAGQQPGTSWLFVNERGQPLAANTVRTHFHRLRARAGGLRNIRLHGLRHTFSSLLLTNGVPVQVVSEMLGHANPSITWKVYSHVLPNQQRVSVGVIERLLQSPQNLPVSAEKQA